MQLAENLTQAKPEEFQRSPGQEEAIGSFLKHSTVEPEENSYPKEMRLNPHDIILDQGTQSRLHEDRDRIDDYARDMEAGDWDFDRRPLPEVQLVDGKYYGIDCHHRVKSACRALHPGRLMLFLVRKGSLAQARIWSASANTLHGLAADNSPQGVRKRIEMFLDNVDFLSPEAYEEEFRKVPNLTEKELKHGRFSDRTIERYLRLRPGQYVTVGNIRKERETAAKIMQHNVGDRVEIAIPEDLDPSKHPDGLSHGEAGTIKEKDRKAIYVEWDRHPGSQHPINLDFIKPSDNPQPPPFTPPRYTPPSSFPNTSSTSGRSSAAPKPETKSKPQEDRAEPESSQSNIGLKEGDRIFVSNPNCYCHGEQGEVGSFTDVNRSNVIVFLDKGERILLRVVDIQAVASTEIPSLEQEEVENPEPETIQAEEARFQEVRSAVQLVCKNIPLLSLEEIEQLQGAISAHLNSLKIAASKAGAKEADPVSAKCSHTWSILYAEPSDPSFKRIYGADGMDAMRACSKCGAIGKVSESGSILQLPQQKWAKHKQDAERWASNLGKFSAVQEAAK